MPDDRFANRTGAPLGSNAAYTTDRTAPDRSPGALVSQLFSDFSDLMQKEIALAKGEFAKNISDKVSGSVWMAVAGVVFMVALLTLVAGVVFLIASFGLAMHLSAFIVAAALIIIGAIMLAAGKSKMSGATLPERSMTQLKQDVRVVKEQMQ
ncbi:MAG: phage holin family protein [Beijerinckiaceae bacterium]|nr:phage holin family protein [Beijerinckiaceae bacterium]